MKTNEIISISLKTEMIDEINRMGKELGSRGRSDTIRAGIKALKDELKEREKLKGKINASLTVVHEHAKNIGKTSHKYQGVIESHLHSHLDKKCVDIFVLRGEARLVKQFVDELRKNKEIDQVRLTIC